MGVMTLSPFTIDLYDKGLTWIGSIGNPITVRGSVVYNGVSNFTIEVGSDDRLVPDLVEYGARITMTYKDVPLFSGMITGVTGSLLTNGSVFVDVVSDWRMLENTLAIIRPSNQIEATTISVSGQSHVTDQAQAWLPGGAATQGTSGTTIGQVGYYQWDAAVNYSETALKTIISENALTRLGRPLTLATDLERGGDIRAAGLLPVARMTRLDEVCTEILGFSNLGLTLQQTPRATTITVDVFEPGVYEAPLTVASEIVVGGSWSIQAPAITRAILGGGGELADRQFVNYTDGSAEIEDTWGDIVEIFREATSGAQLIYPETAPYDEKRVPKYYELRTDVTALQKAAYRRALNVAGARALSEGTNRFGLTAELSETEAFTFGGANGIQLGDQVTIASERGTLYTDRITECSFDFGDNVFQVTPIVGKRLDDPNVQLANAIVALARSQRRISTDR